MIFGDKRNSRRMAQLKSVVEDVVEKALKRQARELAQHQEELNAHLSSGIEKIDTKEVREDVSGWKSSELAGEYRSVIRRAEKWIKTMRRIRGQKNCCII